MPLRPCLGFNNQRCGTLTPKTRCPACQQRHEAARPPRPTTLTRTWTEQQRRAATVRAHIEQHGYWCPGFQRSPHPVTSPNILTADHIEAVGAGGAGGGPLQVLCRECNGRKGDH